MTVLVAAYFVVATLQPGFQQRAATTSSAGISLIEAPASTVAQRILLIGDAAHTIHPLAGQGVNLGFGDVIELARLSQHASDLGAYQFLKRHAQNRLEPVRTMQLGCDGLFKLFQCQTPPAMAWLRNSGLNIMNHLQPIKNQLIKHAMGL